MTNVRTFVRFTFAALFVNALAVACVVEEGDDTSDACDPGSVQSCACGSEEGTKKCNASGSGYGVCVCDSGAGGSDSGGAGSDGGVPGSSGGSGGAAGSGSAGEPGSAGGHASGGAAGADTGGTGSDAGGAAGAAGAGGSGSVLPVECTDDADDCETCYHACCDDWVACSDNSTCLMEYFDILECINTTKEGLGTEPFKPEHLAACANEVGAGTEPWSSALTPETVAMVNCLGGDPADSSWAEMASWGADSCKDLCF